VHLDGSEVSRRHALVEGTPDGFRIKDQGSANGTLVNGQAVDTRVLGEGDLIQLGSAGPRLRVHIVSDEPRPVGTAPTTLITRSFDPTRPQARRYGAAHVGLAAAMLLGGGVLGLLVLLGAAFELGLLRAIVATGVAFAPVPVYLALWLWLDRYDPEPAWVLAGCLAWGAGAATFVSGIANDLFGALVKATTGSAGMAQFLAASVSAPFVEEAAKGLAVLGLLLFLRREFDGVLDGVVYAGVVALGFAAVENVLYYGRSLVKGGAPALMIVFVLRGLLGPFAHAVFTSATGIGCGIARQTHNPALRLLAPALGFLGAVALHSLWNTIAGLAGPRGFFAVYALVWVPLFLVFVALLLVMGHRESQALRRLLAAEVAAGLVTSDQVSILSSWPRRIGWLLSALGDRARLAARRQFLFAASRLALSYGHVERATAAGGQTHSLGQIGALRAEVGRLKTLV
jgi:RsiW-degrading membrane proteinase PrsW (M82 family)